MLMLKAISMVGKSMKSHSPVPLMAELKQILMAQADQSPMAQVEAKATVLAVEIVTVLVGEKAMAQEEAILMA